VIEQILGLERIRNSGVIQSVHVTDSHPRAKELESDLLHGYSLEPLLFISLKEHS
jgi:hypothetical protein